VIEIYYFGLWELLIWLFFLFLHCYNAYQVTWPYRVSLGMSNIGNKCLWHVKEGGFFVCFVKQKIWTAIWMTPSFSNSSKIFYVKNLILYFFAVICAIRGADSYFGNSIFNFWTISRHTWFLLYQSTTKRCQRTYLEKSVDERVFSLNECMLSILGAVTKQPHDFVVCGWHLNI